VAAGENLDVVANRYGVPASAILSANGLSSAAQVTAGRRVIIPVYNAAGTQVAASQPTVAQDKIRLAEAPRTTAKRSAPVVQPARPGHSLAKAEPRQERTPEPPKVAKAEIQPMPQAKAPVAAPAAPAPRQEAAQPAKDPDHTASLPSSPLDSDFRWPARGRVISGFGGAGGNEGINIAVPEGTPVKATEAGTVAYAGNEVKGYGNLVLIRHDNGYVSAYAHNGEITVKRGDKVKRGQVVAKSGQSGNVTSPQLHFEIRKGSTPVDPIPHLTGG
jgi:murein DD-endopeptidase MepM/ murein hydrolase activator NlpD